MQASLLLLHAHPSPYGRATVQSYACSLQQAQLPMPVVLQAC